MLAKTATAAGAAAALAEPDAPTAPQVASKPVAPVYWPAPPQPLKEVQADTSLTCVARVQASLDAIAAHEPRLNACIEVCGEAALKQAAEADARIASGEARRPLEGVPIVVKGNIDVAGTLSTAAMAALADHRPATTAPVVEKLVEAGCVVVAKTTMPEVAFGFWGWSKLHGLTCNAFNDKYSSGGSSSGSAVGIAAGYAPIGLGSDTEGSMRGPTEFAGIVGLRPSRGRYSDAGVVPCNIVHDTVGCMGVKVADVAVMDAVITGSPIDCTPIDLTSIKVAMPPDWCALGAAHEGTKLALEYTSAAFVVGGAAEIKKDEALNFAPLVAAPEGFDELSFRKEGLGAYLASHESLKDTSVEAVLEPSFYPNIKTFFLEPKGGDRQPMTNMSDKEPEEYATLKATYDGHIAEWQARFTKYFDDHEVDVIVTPCTAGPPPLAKSLEEYNDPASFVPLILDALKVYKPIQNGLNGLPIPSLAMPTPAKHVVLGAGAEVKEMDGPPLPAGVCLWGKPGEDEKLLKVAMALENTFASSEHGHLFRTHEREDYLYEVMAGC